MARLKLFLFVLLSIVVYSTAVVAQDLAVGGVYQCGKEPAFLDGLKMSEQTVIDTTVTRLPGVVLRELDGQKRLYQKPSWRQAGNVGGTVWGADGNIYVIPVPAVSLEFNPLEKRNIVYKIDSQSGTMSEFVRLPMPENTSQSNPFGTLGMALDCETNSLYVSSVAGSDAKNASGSIYQINLSSGKIVDAYVGFDAIGLGVFNFPNQKRLYIGDARSSSMYSIMLSPEGRFLRPQAPRHEVSLLEIKNGSSAQIKKIRFTSGPRNIHTMKLSDSDFSYRMQASSSSGQRFRHYEYVFDTTALVWKFEKITY